MLEVIGARSRRSSVENREIFMTRSFVEDPSSLFVYLFIRLPVSYRRDKDPLTRNACRKMQSPIDAYRVQKFVNGHSGKI